MISSDTPSGEPSSTWRFPKSWILLRFKNAWGYILNHLSSTHTLEWSSLKNPMSTWSSWKELGAHTYALEWYFLKRTHKDMEVLTPSPKEERSKSFASDTSWTCEFSWWLGTCKGVPQEKLWRYSHPQVILLELVESLEGWEHVRVYLKRIQSFSHTQIVLPQERPWVWDSSLQHSPFFHFIKGKKNIYAEA
jgi:hypothetical protein